MSKTKKRINKDDHGPNCLCKRCRAKEEAEFRNVFRKKINLRSLHLDEEINDFK